MVPPCSVDDTLPHAMNLLCITAYTAARLTTWLALRNAQSNIQAAQGAGYGSALSPAGSALFG